MRYRLRFQVNHDFGSLLPLNYQLELYRLIRDILMDDRRLYYYWLEVNGIKPNAKQQLFNFSNLIVLERKIYGDRLLILSDTVELTISFFHEEYTEELVYQAFDFLSFYVGDNKSRVKFKVINIEKLAEPNFFPKMSFVARSPIVLQNFETTKYVRYLSPLDDIYLESFTGSLLDKYSEFYGRPYTKGNVRTTLELLSEPKSKLIVLNGSPNKELVKGFLFRFTISAPVEILELGYKIGFGEKNHLGFGFCDVLYSEKKAESQTNDDADLNTVTSSQEEEDIHASTDPIPDQS